MESVSFQAFSNPDGIGAKMVPSLLCLKLGQAYHRAPAFPYLLNIELPIAMLWGTRDVICPYHQGQLLSMLSDATVPCYVLKVRSIAASHAPSTVCGCIQALFITG